jgi:hypothetical protein
MSKVPMYGMQIERARARTREKELEGDPHAARPSPRRPPRVQGHPQPTLFLFDPPPPHRDLHFGIGVEMKAKVELNSQL